VTDHNTLNVPLNTSIPSDTSTILSLYSPNTLGFIPVDEFEEHCKTAIPIIQRMLDEEER